MPTAARLVAAILLCALGWILSDVVRPLMPESTRFGSFNFINAFIGLCTGWIVMGPRAGRGVVAGINNGVTGTAVMMLWAIAVHSSYEMFRLAMRNRYDSPMEAIVAIFIIGSEFGILIATVPVMGVAVTGAVIAGLITESAAKRWN